MTKRRFCFTFFLLICFSLPLTATAQTVNIPDPNLRSNIEDTLFIAPGTPITRADMERLTIVWAPNANISNLTGLEHATNLTELDLGAVRAADGSRINSNTVSDLSPIAGLNKLKILYLELNSISDISPLAGLNNLTVLYLWNNSISDIGSLARLTNLTELSLNSNSISDISPLAGLNNLIALYLGGNSISDILPLAGLTNLTVLYLWSNSISDIGSLVRLTNLTELSLNSNSISDIGSLARLTNLTELFLNSNSISDISPLAGLNNLIWLDLGINVISDISALSGLTTLRALGLHQNSISDISPLAGLNNLTILWLFDNSISDISPLVANTGLGSGATVRVRDNPLNAAAINTHIPTLQRRGVDVRFDPVIAEPVVIPDTNLHAAITTTLGKAPGTVITTADMAKLTELAARNSDITDVTGLEYATNLTTLNLGAEVVGQAFVNSNSVSEISPLAGLTNLTTLNLGDNTISDISPLSGLTNLTILRLNDNSISDISSVSGLISLTRLNFWNNTISDISPLSGLTNLTWLDLGTNTISDISPLSGLTNLTRLDLGTNTISDISPLSGLTNLRWLFLQDNSILDISFLESLTNLEILLLHNNSISDLSSLVANTGLGNGDEVNVSGNPLNALSINTHIPALRSRGVEVRADDLIPTTSEYTLSIPAGISLIHVPLKVTEVDGREQTIESVGELYDVLGGEGNVIYLVTRDSQTQGWINYLSPSHRDRKLTDDMGIIANLINKVPLHLRGNPLGENGNSTITLNPGINLLGLPLRDSGLTHVSDLFALEGIKDNVSVVMLIDNGKPKVIQRASDASAIPIIGGQSFIMTAQRRAMVTISGDAWANGSGTAAAPPVTRKGIEVGNATPVLGLRGAIVDEGTGLNNAGFRITVKNLSTGTAVAAITSPDEAGYQSTVVDIETGRAATVGDILEIFAQSPNPFIGVKPLQYTVTAEDVKQSLIQLPELVAYEIPAETQLLHNYPNPFNPETWIPYQLAEDAFVTLTIYDQNGQIVHTIDVGHQTAAVYENRSKAIYWDGRNGVGEQVASGVYFYHLSAGDYSATRKMLILK